jgi:hypothetical protein
MPDASLRISPTGRPHFRARFAAAIRSFVSLCHFAKRACARSAVMDDGCIVVLSAADPSLSGPKRAAPARPITLPRMMRGVRGQERFPSRGQVSFAYRVRVNFAKPRTTPDLPGHVAAGAVGCPRTTSRSMAYGACGRPRLLLAAAFGLGCTCGLAAILAGLHADLLWNFSHTWIHLLS